MIRSNHGLGIFVMPAVLLAAVTGLYADCQTSGRDRFVRVFFPDGRAITAELAVTDEERARGLMFRENVLADQGMLFVFEDEAPHAFWMKNTLVPLDIIWLGRDKRIVHVAARVPPCPGDPCPSYGPDSPAAYVLELKAGEAEARGLEPGVRLDFVLPPPK